MKTFLASCTLLALVSIANAQTIIQTQPDNTIATASPIYSTPGYFSAVGIGELEPAGDVNFYSIAVGQNDLLTAAITPLLDGLTTPNIQAGIFNASGNLLAFDPGSSGNGFQALVSYQAPISTTYYIGVTGFGDDLFDGDHDQQGPYQIVVGITPMVTPEPASLAPLGLGILFLARKRRNGKGGVR